MINIQVLATVTCHSEYMCNTKLVMCGRFEVMMENFEMDILLCNGTEISKVLPEELIIMTVMIQRWENFS